MKKWFLGMIAVFNCSIFHGGESEKIEILSAKFILPNTKGYFFLSDRSYWKVIPFTKRWRGPIEWWNGVQLVPENYECVPNDWYLGTQIEVYSKYENLEVDQSNASNKKELEQCTHLLVNLGTGQVLFAISLESKNCIIPILNDVYEEGYDAGYSDGYNQSISDTYHVVELSQNEEEESYWMDLE